MDSITASSIWANRDRGNQCPLAIVLTFKIDGTFDRTGLPDPFVMDHEFSLADDRIAALTCVVSQG